MITSKRNATRMVTGDEGSITSSLVGLFAFFTVMGAIWELAAEFIPNHAARNSSPIAIFISLYDNAEWDFYRLKQTGLRGLVGIAIAFIFAYPLGAVLACFGRISLLIGMSICLLLTLPKLSVMLFVPQVLGYNELSVYVIGLWTACLIMLALGFAHARILLQARGEMGDMLESAVIDGVNRWQLWWSFILPLLRNYHFSSLYALTAYVWTSITFAEMQIASGIVGLGRELGTVAGSDQTMDRFYGISFIIWAILGIGSWLVILAGQTMLERQVFSVRSFKRVPLMNLFLFKRSWFTTESLVKNRPSP